MRINKIDSRYYHDGFTLTELIAGVLIVSFLGLAIYHVLSNGLNIWQRATRATTRDQIDIYFEKLTEDIRNASNYATYQFKGDPDSVEFSSVGYSWTGNKQVPRGSRTPNRIRFRFLSDKNSVYRFQENHFQTLNPKNKLTKVTAIANNIVSHQFEYYYAVKYFAYEWRNHWEDVCFPNAVKVSVQYQEYDQLRVISKIISIPHGRCLV